MRQTTFYSSIKSTKQTVPFTKNFTFKVYKVGNQTHLSPYFRLPNLEQFQGEEGEVLERKGVHRVIRYDTGLEILICSMKLLLEQGVTEELFEML